jgi:hypothetical protein
MIELDNGNTFEYHTDSDCWGLLTTQGKRVEYSPSYREKDTGNVLTGNFYKDKTFAKTELDTTVYYHRLNPSVCIDKLNLYARLYLKGDDRDGLEEVVYTSLGEHHIVNK